MISLVAHCLSFLMDKGLLTRNNRRGIMVILVRKVSWKWVCRTWGWIRVHLDRIIELALLAGLVSVGALQAMILSCQVSLSEVG